MNIDLIRLDDTTHRSGEAATASGAMCYEDRRLAREGVFLICPLHPGTNPNVILEADASAFDQIGGLLRQIPFA